MPLLSEIDLTVSAKYSLQSVNVWSESQVANWLNDIGLDNHADNFKEHNITGEVLFDLKHDHLKEMGIFSLSDRMRILILIRRVQEFFLEKSSTGSRSKHLRKNNDKNSGISASPYNLRVDTSISSSRTTTSTSSHNRSRFTSGDGSKSAATRNDSLSRKRVIRVITEDEQSRIIDVTNTNSLKQLFARIAQKLSNGRLDNDNDPNNTDSWSLLSLDKKTEGKLIVDDDIPMIGGRDISGTGEDVIPRYLLKRKQQKDRKKHTKLENFFGERLAGGTSSKQLGETANATIPASGGAGSVPATPMSAVSLSAEKLTKIFGDRPPSEYISGNLSKFFPAVDEGPTPSKQREARPAEVLNASTNSNNSNNNDISSLAAPLSAMSMSSSPGSNLASSAGDTPPKGKNESPIKSAETTVAVTEREIKWSKGNIIGTGSFGNVYMGLNSETGEIMAVKQVAMPDGDEDSPLSKQQNRKKQMIEALHREIALLKDLEHPNIVRYLGSSSNEQFLNIFLEYVPGGSIASALANYGVFEEGLIKSYVKQILAGLDYLHAKDIVHRDIKGANILIDNKGIVKITDFGISKKLGDGKDRGSVISLYPGSNAANRTSALQGSVYWMSPEVVKHCHYTKKSDVWSFGCVVIEMVTGKHPWPELPQMAALYKIGSNEMPEIPSNGSRKLKSMLEQCFSINYRDRPNAATLMMHEFLVSVD